MRTKNSIKNIIATLIVNCINIILGMFSTTLFINFLGIEYTGINGLFSNIISMLSIAELGIGNAIVVNLYKPIHDNDTDKIKTLMHFYKKTYRIIIAIMIAIGVLIIPFLDIIVGDITVPVNLTIAYLLTLFSVISSYFLAHKRSILCASQKEYILKILSVIDIFICNILQIIALYTTKNYYLYVVIKIICQTIENITISIITDHKYKYLKDKNYKKLDKKTEKEIWKKVRALSIHKFSSFIVSGTDNIIISTFLGVISVGLYSNYYLIINNVKSILQQMMNSITASIGDLLTENNKEKNYKVFKKIKFLNTWLAIFTSVCLLVIMQDFICFWIGEEYLLSNFTLLILVINYYQKILQITYKNFKDAAGIWSEDKYVPIIEALLNIVCSIIFVKLFGLAGVFIGTFISSLVYWIYSFPKIIHKGLFQKKYSSYIGEIIKSILLFIITSLSTYKVSSLIIVSNIFIKVIIDIIICCVIPNIILITIFHKNEEFKYFINLLKNIFKNIKKSKKIKLFKSKKDLYINFSKNTNMIIVTGITGSGKSKTSLELKEKYNYELLSFDFIFNYEKERTPNKFEKNILKQFTKQYPQYKDYEKNTKNKNEVSNCFFDFVLRYIETNNIKIIFDGSYFINRIDFAKIKNQRIILKRTSIIKSVFQGINRNKKTINNKKEIMLLSHDNIKRMGEYQKTVNNFIDKLDTLNKEQLTLKELKEIQLKGLLYIRDICKKNNIQYFLMGGTLLGAVKYKGYIPWDDDIDICLFRKDYNKLIRLIEEDNNRDYKILTAYNNKKYYYPYAKLVSQKTRLFENTKDIEEMGVYVDIFPLDYCTDEYENLIEKTMIIKKIIIKRMKIEENQTQPINDSIINNLKQKVLNAINIITLPLGYAFWIKKYDKIISNTNENNNFIGCIWEGKSEIFKKELFLETINYQFEGHKFTGIKKADQYLKQIYGNYTLELPKEEQVSHHQIKVYWREE